MRLCSDCRGKKGLEQMGRCLGGWCICDVRDGKAARDVAAPSTTKEKRVMIYLDGALRFVNAYPLHPVPAPPPPLYPPPLYKLRPCPSYSRRRDRINLGPTFNSVPNVVQPHKTWVW